MRLLYSRIVVKLHFYVIEDNDDIRQSVFVGVIICYRVILSANQVK